MTAALILLLAATAAATTAAAPAAAPAAESLDESLLAIQIGGIVGAYVIAVAVSLSLLLLVGRRLRHQVQSSNYTLQVEMVTPAKPTDSQDPSPITPISSGRANGILGNMSWSSFARGPRSQSANTSVATIDESVVASDRRRAQEEMEMLYAAVREYDEQREAAAIAREPVSPELRRQASLSSPLQSPVSSLPAPPPPPPPPSSSSSVPPASSTRRSKISSLSLFSSSSPVSNKLRSPRHYVRNLAISPPIRSPQSTASTIYGDDQQQQPLTPRLYNPGPPPAVPVSPAPGSQEKLAGRAAVPAPLRLTAINEGAGLSSSASGAASSLPFRDAYPLQSAPATKTTILERPEHLPRGPRTGVATPYSPYMPFTPVTPITPSRMVTKRQRKREGKENGLRVLLEDDLVKSDDDMWGY